MKTVLEQLIQATLARYANSREINMPSPFEFELVTTKDSTHGDLACNAAFKLAKHLKQRPHQVAEELRAVLENEKKNFSIGIEKIEVAGGGFLNFYLSKALLGEILFEVFEKGERYGCSDFGKGRKVLLEFVSANPTGPLTIAHGRQAAVGDSLARILEATGHAVKKEYYLNDAGRQMRLLGESLWARYCELLGRSAVLPQDGYQGAYLLDTAKKLVETKNESLLAESAERVVEICRKFAAEEIMSGIRKDLASIDVSFDHYLNETNLYETKAVEDTLQDLDQKGYLYEKDGALWFRSSDFGDDKDRVLRKATGEYTYLAPDIAYHREKFKRGFNRLINFWGPDHHGYIPRLKAACQALGHSSDQIEIRIIQLTTLYRKGEPVRMSTRAGEFVTLEELVKEVGPDATRFFFVMRKIESHLDFDLDLAKEKSQENPVYYLQYAHARIASLLKFAGVPVSLKVSTERLSTAEETDLIKHISEFPKVLTRASETLEPYRLSDYLRDLAASFHKFYTFHRVVTEDQELTKARLLLADATRIVLRNGLTLLGISHPDSM